MPCVKAHTWIESCKLVLHSTLKGGATSKASRYSAVPLGSTGKGRFNIHVNSHQPSHPIFVIPCTEDEPLTSMDYPIPHTDNLQCIPLEGPHIKGCAPKILFVLEQPYSEDVFPRKKIGAGTALIRILFLKHP